LSFVLIEFRPPNRNKGVLLVREGEGHRERNERRERKGKTEGGEGRDQRVFLSIFLRIAYECRTELYCMRSKL